jgi:quercetin dioxygenase-like cupin family protein
MEDHVHGSFDGLETEEAFPGVSRESFSSGASTVTRYSFEPGGEFPIHKHPAEQITMVLEGTVHLTVEGELHVLGPGEWSVVRGGVEHGIRVVDAPARFLAVVSPRRERTDEYELVDSD